MPNPEISVSQSPRTVSQGYIEYSAPNPAFVTLRAGNKRLILDISSERATNDRFFYAGTHINNVPNAIAIPGATTALYGRVKDILQALANEADRSVRYRFSTSNPNMLNWAMDPEKGVAIFDWENMLAETNGRVHFIKDIRPNKPEQTSRA